MITDFSDLARQYHAQLPERIRAYLHGRGIDDATLERFLIGWSGWRITIPIYDRGGRVTFFKLAKDPADSGDSPKMLATPGSAAELYGWERVKSDAPYVIVCEGEFDRLVLETRGFPAVTSTGGAFTFRLEWAQALTAIDTVYISYDVDAAGQMGALRLARLVPHARLVQLPAEVGEAGDVSDFFIRLGRSPEDFQTLLANAAQAPPDTSVRRTSTRPEERCEIEAVKAMIRIEDITPHYVQDLTITGRVTTGRCPFHADRTPSLVLYPDTQSFYCFGCRASGDVIALIMKAERLSFRDAVQLIRRSAA